MAIIFGRTGHGVLARGLSSLGLRSWARDAAGEIEVAEILEGLGDEFGVFHDFRVCETGGRDLFRSADHIVVGPTGLFVVETRSHAERTVPAASLCATNRGNVQGVRQRASDLRERISVWSGGELDHVRVEPVLVYAHSGAFIEERREKDVRVIPLRWLRGDVEHRPVQRLSSDERLGVGHTLYGRLAEEARKPLGEAFERMNACWKAPREVRQTETVAAPSWSSA